MVGHEYGSSTGFIGVTGYSTGGVPIDDNRTPADYNCVKYRGGRRSYRKSKGRKNRKSHRAHRKSHRAHRKSRKQRGGSSGNGGYGFVLDNQYTGKFYDSLVKGPCPTPQRGGAYPPQIFQHKMSYNALTDAVSTNSAHYANRGANPSYCGGRRSKKVKGRKHRKH